MDKNAITYVLHIGAAPEKVWQGLTRSEFTKQYWAGQYFDTDWKVCSELNHRMPDGRTVVKGKILVSDEPKTLSYSWKVDMKDNPASGVLTRITFLITAFKSTTALTLVQEGHLAGTEAHTIVSNVWRVVLCGLKTLLETGKPLPFDWMELFEGKSPRLK
jgi:uncharacterized protein YndB with AHSA1/START domain